jgi:hypothetical protein
MVFVRIHLDDTDAINGAMEIALGSHLSGRVSSDEAAEVATAAPSEVCTASKGDVLILKMLTLHRSKSANLATQRRALRIDYAAEKLPAPLEWAFEGYQTVIT